jgi:O-antigen/teichoic acid export membrane protein
MPEEKASYRQIFKATSLFGGVQVFTIVIAIVRSKVIAVLLGPTGMGIAGLLTSTMMLVSSLTNFGLGVSSVKNIAAANESGHLERIATVVMVLRKLVWFTGLLGMLVTLAFSPLLSELTFGNRSYTAAFIWLSLTLLFNQLTTGQGSLLQGMRKLNRLAKANVASSVLGLIVSVPLYYFYKIDGIVPALIATSICGAGIAWYFARGIQIENPTIDRTKTISEGKSMLRMGFMLSVSGLLTVGASAAVRIYISNVGGVADVGLYSAGFAIIGTYVSLVFSAMATDFYPRLSGVAHDNERAREIINHQAEVAILILSPILCIFLIFIAYFVILLYSFQFIRVSGMIHWATLGMYFKAASWSIAFIILAKGHSKAFFWNELIGNAYALLFNLLGYRFFGLDGLGISFLVSYLLYLLQVFFFTRSKYNFSFNKEFYTIFFQHLVLGLLAFFVIKFVSAPIAYLLGLLIIGIALWYSLKEMEKRVGLKSWLMRLVKKTSG